jgi:hypothetical protein
MIGKISILLIVYFSSFLSQIIVNTPCGPILGRQFDGVQYYEGVEFGNSKRFEHSTPASCWKGTYDATKLGE